MGTAHKHSSNACAKPLPVPTFAHKAGALGKLINTAFFRVRFSEVDTLRIVWHGNYLKYFEDGRDAWGAEFGLDFVRVYEDHGLLAPLVSTELKFKQPMRYNDRGRIETEFVPTPAAKVIFHYRIFDDATGQLRAEGATTQVFTDTGYNLQLCPPPFFEEWKRAHGLL